MALGKEGVFLTGTGGDVTITQTTAVTTSHDLTQFIGRGDQLRIGNEYFSVACDVSQTFGDRVMPLATLNDCNVAANYLGRPQNSMTAYKRPQTNTMTVATSAATMQSELENLETLGLMLVERTDTATQVTWDITFLSDSGPRQVIFMNSRYLEDAGTTVTPPAVLIPGVHPDNWARSASFPFHDR